jgi:hypothetical protein
MSPPSFPQLHPLFYTEATPPEAVYFDQMISADLTNKLFENHAEKAGITGQKEEVHAKHYPSYFSVGFSPGMIKMGAKKTRK